MPRISIANLPLGGYRYEVLGGNRFAGNGYLVMRKLDGQIQVFYVAIREGKVVLPDLHWWSYGSVCSQFVPAPMAGRFDPDLVIHCGDDEQSKWSREQHRWDAEGKNLGTQVDDLHSPSFVAEGDEIVLWKRN